MLVKGATGEKGYTDAIYIECHRGVGLCNPATENKVNNIEEQDGVAETWNQLQQIIW